MLKALESVNEADERCRNMVVGSPSTGIRFMTIADHHSHIAKIELAPDVPERIIDAFERARNAYLYAWFVYDLTPLAQSQGYAALEMALRDRLGSPPKGQKRWSGLGQLLITASERDCFAGLPLPHPWTEAQREEFLQRFTETTRSFRNELAHGSGYLNSPGATLDALTNCATLINCLYRADC